MAEEIEQFEHIYRIVAEFLVTYSFQFLGALLILAVGIFFANRIGKLVSRLCAANELDVTLSNFISGLAKFAVVAMVAISKQIGTSLIGWTVRLRIKLDAVFGLGFSMRTSYGVLPLCAPCGRSLS